MRERAPGAGGTAGHTHGGTRRESMANGTNMYGGLELETHLSEPVQTRGYLSRRWPGAGAAPCGPLSA